MKLYDADETLRESGATPEELEEIKAQGLLVPHRRWEPLPWGDDCYTENQIEVLRWIVKARRITRKSREDQTAPAN